MTLADGAALGGASTDVHPPEIVGFHHVRVPVADVLVSRDWYIDVLGFASIVVEEEEDRIVGVALGHPSGVVVGLHEAPARAEALRGFVVVGLAVPDIDAWVDYLDRSGIGRGELVDGHLGRYVDVADPDGLLVELHTMGHVSAADA